MKKKKTGKFQDIFTPKSMIDELLNYIPLKNNDNILEPTAGIGNLCIPLLDRCKNISINLTANEIQESHFNELKENLSKYGNTKNVKSKDLIDLLF